jgi:hypothetical protein
MSWTEPEYCPICSIPTSLCECSSNGRTVRTLVETHFPERDGAQSRAGMLASESYNLGVQVGLKLAALAQKLADAQN